MPKQISKNNSVIPYQLHLADLHAILKNNRLNKIGEIKSWKMKHI